MTVPEGVADPSYVTLLNENNYRSYQALMYPEDNYTATVALPSGMYIYMDCSLTTDPDSRFWAETHEVSVEAGTSQIVEITLLDSGAK